MCVKYYLSPFSLFYHCPLSCTRRLPSDGADLFRLAVAAWHDDCLANTVGIAPSFSFFLLLIPNPASRDDSASKQSGVKCSLHKCEYLVAFQWALVHRTCFSHSRLNRGSSGNSCSVILLLEVLEQPAATHLYTILLDCAFALRRTYVELVRCA